MNWYAEIEEYVKWSTSGIVRRVTFLQREPKVYIKRFNDGTERKVFEWKVTLHENGTAIEKTLSPTSKRLLEILASEDKKASLLGRCFDIRSVGERTSRNWEVAEVSVE